MQRTNKIWNIINLSAIGILVTVIVIGIIFAFAPKIKNKDTYQKIYEANKAKTEKLKLEEE